MSRIRTVKPELFLDEDLGRLPGDAVMLFVGLWTIADKEGRLEYRPARIKATLFPYREVNLEELVNLLESAGATERRPGSLRRYEVEGQVYLQVTGFTRHQRPHPKEPASTLPAPPAWSSREKTRLAVEGLASIPSSPVGREGKGREGKEIPAARGAPADLQEGLLIEPLPPVPTIEPEPEPPPASKSPPPAHDVGPGQANGVRRDGSPSARQARQKGSQGPAEASVGHPRRQLSDALMAVYFDVCGCKYPFGSRDAAKLEDILRLAEGDIGEAAARFRWALSDAPPWQGGPPREGATKFIYRLPAVWAALAGAPRVRAAATGPPWLSTPAGAAWKAGLARVRQAGAPVYLLERIESQVAECRLDGDEVVIEVDRFGADALQGNLPAEALEAFGALRWEVGEG